MRQQFWTALVAAAFALTFMAFPAVAQENSDDNPVGNLPWQVGPAQGAIADKATMEIPDGYAFLDAEGTRKLNELLENPPADADEYTLAPKDLRWFAFFHFSDVGYVKDNESLDADAILESVREGTEASNAVRRERGWDPLHVTGWNFKPQYDKQLNNLEWAIEAENERTKHKLVNYNTRLLGRRGVMEVTVAASPEGLQAAIAQFKGLMPGYSFDAGEKYAEFKAGDHVAEYGLAALITGGAAAVATKKGLFAAIAVFLAKAWKLVLIGIVGIGAVVRKFFSRKSDSQAQ